MIKKVHKTLLIYAVITIAFAVWMAFYDDHSIAIHRELDLEISNLKSSKKTLTSNISAVLHQIETLKNPDSLEKYAREEFFYKAEDEIIYIIDSTTINSLAE
ncbi:MAG: septum formation initiator family protein [Flavobacteriaceae bacterium]|nr:septum formation initiator family protein [Flavobacteriaceae bacterium]MCY4217348.1 septum formation initiator family protein [Flavobacteriaceae bacterium]MCY4254412.1 septum formation initiator family protein [Flavobacteriaceae bacterium]